MIIAHITICKEDKKKGSCVSPYPSKFLQAQIGLNLFTYDMTRGTGALYIRTINKGRAHRHRRRTSVV